MYDGYEDGLRETMECPECGGDLGFLGVLGNVNWYQCRNCGVEVGKEACQCQCLYKSVSSSS